ncbi:MAG TPA: phage tail protein, partial [Solirubrobacterales bacterium]|nr:phage tail protein [Solirubrobacterales bacterium]
MNDRDPDFLYQLLPEYLRFRDVSEGEPLRALFRALDGEYRRLARNMDSLYDDWFIETCSDWVVPYIAELVGVRGLDRPGGFRRSDRALVGNAIRNRRRKGVPAALGETASEATGWPTLAVAAIPRLATTQAMAHPEPRRRTTVSLRDAAALALLGTPFDVLAHTASVTGGRERWNIPGMWLFRWRLESYPVERAAARVVAAGGYTFHP